MRVFKYLLIGIAALLLIAFGVGYRLPQQHTATREREYAATPERVYAEIATPSQYARWRSGVQSVEMLPDSGGMKRFREIAMDGTTTYEIEQQVPGRRFVTRIADDGLPYGGAWIFDLSPTPGAGTKVSITEEGEVYNAFFRFVSRYVIGHTRGLDKYLDDLDKRLGSGPPPA